MYLKSYLLFYRFIDKYEELKSNSELDDGALFEETAKALLKDGITLRRRGAPFVSIDQFSVHFSKYICYRDRQHFNSKGLLQPWDFTCIHFVLAQ